MSVLWVGVLSALCGALGLLTFYLALDRGSASLAVPVIGFYPAVVAVLSVAFLDEKLSGLQVLGVALAVSRRRAHRGSRLGGGG